MGKARYEPYNEYKEYPQSEMFARSEALYAEMKRRRTVRHFSDRAVPKEVLENCLRVAGLAPSGANHQPWYFVVVTDQELKKRLRTATEEVEEAFYASGRTRKWVEALEHLGTTKEKPFMEEASTLIVIFSKSYTPLPDGTKQEHYYTLQSVGIATGMLITAIHNAGLVSLTYTPPKMIFLNQLLERPLYERPYMVLAVGYPCDSVTVPTLTKKPLSEIADFR